MKKLSYLALALSLCTNVALANTCATTPTATETVDITPPAVAKTTAKKKTSTPTISTTTPPPMSNLPPMTSSVQQDIFNNEKKFELDAGYGNTWIPAGPVHDLNLIRAELDYFPMAFRYYNLALGIDGSYNFIDQSNVADGEPSRLVIFSASPVLRYYIRGTGPGTHAYVEAGIGGSYLTSKYLGDTNFGIQYAFQLMAGAGVRFNFPTYAIVAGYRFVHWSNGNIAHDNAGINIPLLLYIGVQI